ncbi:uncharacterized protein LOC143371990 [Andrena cerasifolii]|uniref:uncharacterized protein LOC143371990 n=1 Tax=Andrena cerasifolii TaxID=2819439 RepID=UPI004038334B
MDDLLSLKDKHMNITDSQIKELLEKKIKLIDQVKNKQNQQCSEDEMKINELTSQLTSMKESLQSEKQVLEYKDQDLAKHLNYIAELEAEKNKFLEESQSIELKRNELKRCKQNLTDQRLLDLGRKRYNLYKEVTRVRWDFDRIDKNVEGYVTNKRDYVHHFCYNSEKTDLTDLLWQEICRSTVPTESKDVSNKENIIQNE